MSVDNWRWSCPRRLCEQTWRIGLYGISSCFHLLSIACFQQPEHVILLKLLRPHITCVPLNSQPVTVNWIFFNCQSQTSVVLVQWCMRRKTSESVLTYKRKCSFLNPTEDFQLWTYFIFKKVFLCLFFPPVRYLLKNNVSPDLCNEDGLTALHQVTI